MHLPSSFLSTSKGTLILLFLLSKFTQAQTFTTGTTSLTTTTTISPPITNSKGQTTLIDIPVLESSLPSQIGVYGSIVRADVSETVYTLACVGDTQLDHTDAAGHVKPIDYCSWLYGSLTVRTTSGGRGMTTWMMYDNTHSHGVYQNMKTEEVDGGPREVASGVTYVPFSFFFTPSHVHIY